MGFNATVAVMVDALHVIAEDKEFGKRLHDAILAFDRDNEKNLNCVPAITTNGKGIYSNAAVVIDNQHASVKSIVAVGGNCGKILGYSTAKEDIDILKELADKLGYSLRKKPVK